MLQPRPRPRRSRLGRRLDCREAPFGGVQLRGRSSPLSAASAAPGSKPRAVKAGVHRVERLGRHLLDGHVVGVERRSGHPARPRPALRSPASASASPSSRSERRADRSSRSGDVRQGLGDRREPGGVVLGGEPVEERVKLGFERGHAGRHERRRGLRCPASWASISRSSHGFRSEIFVVGLVADPGESRPSTTRGSRRCRRRQLAQLGAAPVAVAADGLDVGLGLGGQALERTRCEPSRRRRASRGRGRPGTWSVRVAGGIARRRGGARRHVGRRRRARPGSRRPTTGSACSRRRRLAGAHRSASWPRRPMSVGDDRLGVDLWGARLVFGLRSPRLLGASRTCGGLCGVPS